MWTSGITWINEQLNERINEWINEQINEPQMGESIDCPAKQACQSFQLFKHKEFQRIYLKKMSATSRFHAL